MSHANTSPAITTARACVVVLYLLLLLPLAFAGETKNIPPRKSIPGIAGVARIQIGTSTQDDLAARWGEGKTIIGGHPNSGRLWRVKGTHWLLHTDAFEYSQRGLVVDHLEIRQENGMEKSVPYARLSANDFAWLGEISLGATRDKVTEVLKKKGLPMTPTDLGCETRAPGFQALAGPEHFGIWIVQFDFKSGLLTQIAINACFGKR